MSRRCAEGISNWYAARADRAEVAKRATNRPWPRRAKTRAGTASRKIATGRDMSRADLRVTQAMGRLAGRLTPSFFMRLRSVLGFMPS